MSAEIELVIPFHHVDLLNIAWHGHYCEYLEAARCAMLGKIGYDYMAMKETGFVWPIIDIQLRYLQPARFGQRIRVLAELVEWEYRMKIKYRIFDAETGRVLVKAHTMQVAVDAVTGEMCYASPRVFLDKLEAFMGV
ncbi:acyl-CoA thioesterase [Methylomagnum sp.]